LFRFVALAPTVNEHLLRSSPDTATDELSEILGLRRFKAEARPEAGMVMCPF